LKGQDERAWRESSGFCRQRLVETFEGKQKRFVDCTARSIVGEEQRPRKKLRHLSRTLCGRVARPQNLRYPCWQRPAGFPVDSSG
jgi:hypothetical protein